MSTAVARLFLVLAIVATACIIALFSFTIWYRNTDHTQRLLDSRAELVEARETVLPDSAGRRRVAFRLLDSRGRQSQGMISIPEGASGPLPAVLILGGHGTGARAVELVRLGRPAVLCGLDYPSIPEYRVGPLEAPGLLFTLDSLVLDATAMAFTALDYLCSRPEVDTTRLTVLGASFGAPFAVIAGLDERVDGMALLYGGAELERVIDRNLRRKVQSPWLRRPAAFLLGTLAAPYDPASYVGRFAPRPLLLVNGSGDERLPEECAQALFAAAGEPKEQVWMEGSHLHPSNTALLDSLTATVSAWMVHAGLLP